MRGRRAFEDRTPINPELDVVQTFLEVFLVRIFPDDHFDDGCVFKNCLREDHQRW